MKKFLLSIFVSLFLLPCTLVSAQDPFSDQRQITLFKSTITVEKNTEINIREEITYYFPGYNHGIIREIPTDYKTGGGFKRPTTLTLNDLYYYPKGQTTLSNTMYERSSKMGYSIFKIGDPETTITGEYTFVIDYTLHNAVNFFDDHDEIYLNITGNGTDVPINKSYAEIKLPGEITEKICFTGMVGSEEKNCDFEEISSNETRVNMKGSLEPYEGLTVALKMPKGSLNDTSKTQLIEVFLANIGILLPLPIFFLVLYLVKSKGKNKKLTIIPNYDAPKDIYPLLAGQIFNNTVNNKHITAEIIKLAIDGHIKIKEDGKNKFILAKDNISKEILEEAPRALYAGIFKFQDAMKSAGLKPIIGCEIYIAPRSMQEKEYGIDNNYFHLVVLAKNYQGYKNLMKIVSVSNMDGFYYRPRIDFETLSKYSDGLIALSACLAGPVARPIMQNNVKLAKENAERYARLFKDNFYIEIQKNGMEQRT